jgi:hypothetical protein
VIPVQHPNRGRVGIRPDATGIHWGGDLPTYRQVDYWIRGDGIPGHRARGSGVYRAWTHDELARLRSIKPISDTFRQLGLPLTCSLVRLLWAAADPAGSFPPVVVGPLTIVVQP